MSRKMINPVVLVGVIALLAGTILLGCQQAAPAPTQPPAAAATKAPAASATQAPGAAATQAPAIAATQAPAAQATAVPSTLKIGISMGMTGPSARGGMISERVMRMAIEDINAKGGVKVGGKTYRLEAVTADDKFSAEGGREAANRLALAEKVKIVLGPGGQQATAGAQPVYEENKVLMIPTGAPATALGPSHNLTLSIGAPHSYPRFAVLNQWLVKTYPQAKRIALISVDDAAGRGGDGPIFEETAKASGLNIVAQEFYPPTTADFSAVVVRVLAQKPDVIELDGSTGASPARFMPIAKALNEQGYKGLFLGAYGFSTAPQAGPGAEGFTFPVLVDGKSSALSAMAKDVANRYIQKYGEGEFEASSVVGNYNLPYVLAQALEKAGTVDDTAKIAATLRDGEWDTTFGKVAFGGVKIFGAKVQFQPPIFLSKVEGGKVVTFDVLPGLIP